MVFPEKKIIEDIVRNKFLIDIVNKYEKWKSENDEKGFR